MALDTRERRSSAINVASPWRGLLPLPDNSVGQPDRPHVAFHYEGIPPSTTGGDLYHLRTLRLPENVVAVPGAVATRTVTAAYTITISDRVILCDATVGAFTVSLPASLASIGRQFYIKKIDASSNVVTIDADATEEVDGGLTADLTTQYESVTLVSDGTAWWIL